MAAKCMGNSYIFKVIYKMKNVNSIVCILPNNINYCKKKCITHTHTNNKFKYALSIIPLPLSILHSLLKIF